MKLNFWKKHRARGRISPEAKAKTQQAKTEAYLANVWLKMLKENPELAQRIAERKFGVEAIISGGNDDYEKPDLLEILKTAKEAKQLVQDELGDSKTSMWKDILKALPAIPAILSELREMQTKIPIEPPKQPRLPQPEPKSAQEPPQEPPGVPKLEARMASLLELLDLEPEQAYQELVRRGETGWIAYLKGHSSEEMLGNLQELTKDPEHGEFIRQFVEEKSHWLEELVLFAHQTQ